MAYQVIARKWRPQIFEEVIGQEAITRTLRNAIEHDRLHHAYVFSGARGVGKTTTARLLAKALNCHKTESPNPKPCDTSKEGACPSCVEISEGRSLDVLEFDAASHTKVEEIRDIILEGININPARDRFKVFIIDEVHMLSKSSFNALLKTLEEPPERVVFMMATTEHHKVPVTILSRCQEFEFHTIPLKEIFGRLRMIADAEKIEVEDHILLEIARSGEGSMRDAQSNFDQVISFSEGAITSENVGIALGIAGAEVVIRALEAIGAKDHKHLFEIVAGLADSGHDLGHFSNNLMICIRDLLVYKLAGEKSVLIESSSLDEANLEQIASRFSETDLIRCFNSLAETSVRMRSANEPRYLLEIGLLKLVEMRSLANIEDLIKRFESGIPTHGESQVQEQSDDTASMAAAADSKKKL
ncbi:MAG: DNA polymerase III subunit gamma/tau [Pyrinomonadaceae bacterium]|nr:DNA polymerase III subunit gamma/tau [Pyrinomonadaceae bacterium]